MSTPPLWSARLTPTLILSEMPPNRGDSGFWLYDETRGMNLAMRAKTEREAFVEVISYYQGILMEREMELASMAQRVEAFVALFPEYHTSIQEEH